MQVKEVKWDFPRDAPSLEVFKVSLNGALGNWTGGRCSYTMQGSWKWMIFHVPSKPNQPMRTHMETLLDFKPPLGLELIFSYELSIIDCISCGSQQNVLLPISGFLSEAVWDSALPDHSSILMPSVECANKNMKHHGLVICTTPSFTFSSLAFLTTIPRTLPFGVMFENAGK